MSDSLQPSDLKKKKKKQWEMLTGGGLTADFAWGTLQSILCVLAHLLFNPMALVYYPHFTKEELRLRML